MSGRKQRRVIVKCNACRSEDVETAANRAKFAICRKCSKQRDSVSHHVRYAAKVGYIQRYTCGLCGEQFVNGLCGCKE